MNLSSVDEGPQRHSSRPRQIFYSAAAQEDNLGDVVIRRTVLEWITGASDQVHLFRGHMSDSYIEALRAPDSVTVHDSARSFTTAWLRSCARRQAALVYAPGPRTANRTASSAKAAAQMVAMTALTRSSGGPVLAVGGAIRGEQSLALRLHRLNASKCSDYSVRDPLSRDLLKGCVRVIPDVAFAGANPRAAVPDRPVLAISLRFDRVANLPALRALVDSAQASGVQPIIVTQVRRDQENHLRLADELGVELCGWTTESHLQQLDRIENLYSRALVVVSDRLHSCILGGRHGAVVINADPKTSEKLKSTLPVIYSSNMPAVEDFSKLHTVELANAFDRLSAGRGAACADVRIAAQTLRGARSSLTALLRLGIREMRSSAMEAFG